MLSKTGQTFFQLFSSLVFFHIDFSNFADMGITFHADFYVFHLYWAFIIRLISNVKKTHRFFICFSNPYRLNLLFAFLGLSWNKLYNIAVRGFKKTIHLIKLCTMRGSREKCFISGWFYIWVYLLPTLLKIKAFLPKFGYCSSPKIRSEITKMSQIFLKLLVSLNKFMIKQ